jgi:hypothetical protein
VTVRAGAALGACLSSLVACAGGGDGGGATTSTTEAPPATTTSVPFEAGTPVEPAVYEAAVGDCFDRRAPDPAQPDLVVLLVGCDLPHTYEVFGLWTHPAEAGAGYPVLDELEADARSACVAQLPDFVGRPYELSVLEVEALVPTQGSWVAGNRDAACVAYHREGTLLVGSQRGADI